MLLYVNCCPREDSRTDRIARALLKKLGPFEELNVYAEKLKPVDSERLACRPAFIERRDYKDSLFKYAKQFAGADQIVIAAPYWDLSFPAMLKTYIENIYVTGIVSRYDENGRPQGLCKAKKLYYVTSAGGPYDGRFSYEYLKTLAQDYFGIREVQLIQAEMLDIAGNDPEKIVKSVIDAIRI